MRQKTSLFIFLCLTLATSITTGCAKPDIVAQTDSKAIQTQAGRVLPAQIDLVIVPDNSGSITNALDTVQNQISSFVASLQNANWDYHIAISVLNNPPPITQVLVNPKYNNSTLPDGTPNPNASIVPSQYTFADVSSLLGAFAGISVDNGSEDNTYWYTYTNIFNTLHDSQASTKNLFRRDALLAIIVISNGAEYSVDPYHNGDFDMNGTLKTWADRFVSLKRSSEFIRFYPVVANSWHPIGTCEGGSSFIGTSYTDMLQFMNGMSADFCDPNALSNVLGDIKNNLQSSLQKYIYSYLVLDAKPNPSTIKITKQDGTVIPQDHTNGWTYLGGPQTVDMVTAYIDPNTGKTVPFQAFAKTGWVIQLNGSAQLTGSDQVNITYAKP